MGNYYKTEVKFSYSAHEAFEKSIAILDFLEWSPKNNGTDLITASTCDSAFGFGEKIRITFKKHRLIISSESRYLFQCFDLGKNESNVDKFIYIFKRAKLPFDKSQFVDEKPRSMFERFLSGR
jgi:hypothetical protein